MIVYELSYAGSPAMLTIAMIRLIIH